MRPPEQCVILIGGLGTRLGELTADVPKPLLPVAGKPFLEYLLLEASRFGFKRVLLLAGYRAERVRDYLTSSKIADRLDLQIDVSIETEPVGTGGALWLARDRLDPSFYLINGDSWFECNWLSLVTVGSAKTSLATMALRRLEDPGRYGAVELENSYVRRFLERSQDDQPALVNCGVYFMRREIIGRLSPECSLERDVFPTLAEARQLSGQVCQGRFLDIGVPIDFAMAQDQIPTWRCRPAVFFDRDGTLNEDDGYTHRRDQFRWTPGAETAVRKLNDVGFYVFIVTNQSGVARGFYQEADVLSLHDWMQSELRTRGAHIDDFRYCPYHPDAAIERYRSVHPWRKPAPGMLQDLLQHWPVDVARSVVIGDTDADIEAGRAAGLKGIKLAPGGLALAAEVDAVISRFAKDI